MIQYRGPSMNPLFIDTDIFAERVISICTDKTYKPILYGCT